MTQVHLFSKPPEFYRGKIPVVLTTLIEELERRDVTQVDGVFRLCGSEKQIRAICEALDSGEPINWDNYTDIHAIAGALKKYFRQMTDNDPIVSNEIVPCIMAIQSNNSSLWADMYARMLPSLLTPSRYYTLMHLIRFLRTIADKSNVNRMNPTNLAICWGPNLIDIAAGAPDIDPQSALGIQNDFVCMLIEKCSEIFGTEPIDPSRFFNEEDLAALTMTPIDTTGIQHQIIKCKLRANSLIPYAPACRVFACPQFAIPTRVIDDTFTTAGISVAEVQRRSAKATELDSISYSGRIL